MKTKTITAILALCVLGAILTCGIDISTENKCVEQPTTTTIHPLLAVTPYNPTPTPTVAEKYPVIPFAIVMKFGSHHQSNEMTLLPDGTMVTYPAGAFNSIDGWGKTRDPLPAGNWEYVGTVETRIGTVERYNLLNTKMGIKYRCPIYVDLLSTGNGQTIIVGGDTHNKCDAVHGVIWRNVQ